MIVKCEECQSKFNLDVSLLKQGGSKVRCSECKNIFTAFSPEQEPTAEPSADLDYNEAFEETVALDSLPVLDKIGPEHEDEGTEESFDQAFEKALDENIQDAPPDETLEPTESVTQTTRQEAASMEIPLERPEVDLARPSLVLTKKGLLQSKPLLVAIVIFLILIAGALVVFFFAPDFLPDSLSSLKPVKKDDIIDTGVRRLTLKGVNGSFIQSNKLGQLFVIKGTVVNDNPKSRSFTLLKGTILDDKGEAIRRKLVYAGNTFTEVRLKEMALEAIDKGLKNKSGKGNTNVDVKSGSSIPFMIIFENLPENLGEFIVEAISSSPGK
ncbi:DUF3426 domain-containing protein [Thermodesulfobacteriota bacterium]